MTITREQKVNKVKKKESCNRCRARRVICDGILPACCNCLKTAEYKRRELSSVICSYTKDQYCSEDKRLDQSNRVISADIRKVQVRRTYKKRIATPASNPAAIQFEAPFEHSSSSSSSSLLDYHSYSLTSPEFSLPPPKFAPLIPTSSLTKIYGSEENNSSSAATKIVSSHSYDSTPIKGEKSYYSPTYSTYSNSNCHGQEISNQLESLFEGDSPTSSDSPKQSFKDPTYTSPQLAHQINYSLVGPPIKSNQLHKNYSPALEFRKEIAINQDYQASASTSTDQIKNRQHKYVPSLFERRASTNQFRVKEKSGGEGGTVFSLTMGIDLSNISNEFDH